MFIKGRKRVVGLRISIGCFGMIQMNCQKMHNNGFTLTKIGGCSWDYLFSISVADVERMSCGDTTTIKFMVEELVKYTLKDARGYVDGVTEDDIMREVEVVTSSLL